MIVWKVILLVSVVIEKYVVCLFSNRLLEVVCIVGLVVYISNFLKLSLELCKFIFWLCIIFSFLKWYLVEIINGILLINIFFISGLKFVSGNIVENKILKFV